MLGTVSILGDSRRAYAGTSPEPARVTAGQVMERQRTSAEAGARLRRIVDEHYDFIWRALRGLGVTAAGADDAAQQVFLVASQKLDAIVAGSERAFLFATARGIASNARRSQARNRELLDDHLLAAQVDQAPNPEQAALTSEARHLLERLLDRMPDDLRTVFVLFELEGMTTSAIAEILAIPAGTVASRLRRAREDFAREAEGLRHSGRGGKP